MNNVLEFIKSCVKRRQIYWTYHANMRLKDRYISRLYILNSVDTYEIIEEYPHDKYLPSYLVFAKHKDLILHIQIAVNTKSDTATIVTAYKPTLNKWEKDFKTRRQL